MPKCSRCHGEGHIMGSEHCVLDDSYVRPSARPPFYEDIASKTYLAQQHLELDEAEATFQNQGSEVLVEAPSARLSLIFSIKVIHSLFCCCVAYLFQLFASFFI